MRRARHRAGVRRERAASREPTLILHGAGMVYGSITGLRRRWYARDPERRRRLRRPVVSVGNLSIGGAGKTPVVAHLARLLTRQGERPSILSRGYGRRIAQDGVTVVSDGTAILADLDHAGDEPLMLARALPGVPVLVGASRYLSGTLAEERLDVTIHVLDDGFQHLELARDIDLLVVSEEDVKGRPLPAGRLREPLQAAAAADALLIDSASDESAGQVRTALGVATAFRIVRTLGAPYPLANRAERERAAGDLPNVPPEGPVFALAAIARPARFFSGLTSAGWQVAGSMAFRDHHLFTGRDVERVKAAAGAAGIAMVLTTEKDAVRLEGHDLGGLRVCVVPLRVTIEPAPAFLVWLEERVAAARASRPPLRSPHRL